MDDIDRLLNLLGAVADDILNMTDEEVLQETAKEGLDIELEREKFRALLELAIARVTRK